jgi:tripartite ATP-independent transporter DctP family solute receptor
VIADKQGDRPREVKKISFSLGFLVLQLPEFKKKRGRRTMLKKFRCLVFVLALVLVVVSCTTFAAKKPMKVIYGSVFQFAEDFGKGDLYFKKLVKKESKGRILVECYENNQLGSAAEMYQAVKTGAQHMVTSSLGDIVPFYSKLATFDLPYLYRDQTHCLKVADKFTSIFDQEKMAAASGLRIISARIRAPRHLTTKFPVNKLEDIKGIKMRVPQQPVSVALWKALGTIPSVIPGAEIYTALATGVIDAQENPVATIYIGKFYEQTKYCALTAHKTELIPVTVNAKWWKSLTATQKKIITKAMDKSTKMVNKLILKSEAEYKKKLEEVGMKFTRPDVAPFREKAKTIWGQFGDEKMIKKIEAVK